MSDSQYLQTISNQGASINSDVFLLHKYKEAIDGDNQIELGSLLRATDYN